MDFVVVLDPSVDEPARCLGVRSLGYADIVALQSFDEGFRHTVQLRARDVEQGIRLSLGEQPCLPRGISRAIVREISIAFGAWVAWKRFSTASNIMSRTSEPERTALATAVQAMISRSKASMMKAGRMTSPFQQVNSSPSEHQRGLERMTMTLPSWMRVLRTAVSPSNEAWRPSPYEHMPQRHFGVSGQGAPLARSLSRKSLSSSNRKFHKSSRL